MSKKSSTFAPAFEKERVFLAQLVEQLTLNQWVQGSSPWEDTKRHLIGCLFLFCRMSMSAYRCFFYCDRYKISKNLRFFLHMCFFCIIFANYL